MSESWAVRVFGTPSPKGSMKCIGAIGGGKRGRHQLVNQLPGTKPWQQQIAEAARRVREHYELDGPLDGPLGVKVTTTVARPGSVAKASRVWPWKRQGDVDKLARTVLDGLQDGGLLVDDAQVCELVTIKAYPDTDGVPDRLDQPGAFVRLYRLPDHL